MKKSRFAIAGLGLFFIGASAWYFNQDGQRLTAIETGPQAMIAANDLNVIIDQDIAFSQTPRQPQAAEEIVSVNSVNYDASIDTTLLFGGTDPNKWKLESIIGDGFHKNLITASTEIVEIVVSIPMRMVKSEIHSIPLNESQTNASLDFGPTWKIKEIPAIGRRMIDNKGVVSYRISFNKLFNISEAGQTKIFGDWLFIQPKGKQDWWAFNFGSQQVKMFAPTGPTPIRYNYMLSQDESEKAKGKITPDLRKLQDGRTAPDPLRIAQQLQGSNSTAAEVVIRNRTAAGYKDFGSAPGALGTFDRIQFIPATATVPGQPFVPYPPYPSNPNAANLAPLITAVGKTRIIGIEGPPVAPFRQYYSCMEPRNMALEAKEGVPSGVGWHMIGDPAITIFNDLEKESLLLAVSSELKTIIPKPLPNEISGQQIFNVGLTHIATGRWLRPMEAGYATAGQFRWFANTATTPFCVEQWAHPCKPLFPNTPTAPNNNWGFNCQ